MKIRIRKSDTLFSTYIRTRDKWTCQRCFTKYPEGSRGLHCSHFYGRARESTRHDPENCVSHCHGCHAYLTANPEEHRAWKLKQLGEKRYKALMVRANNYKRRDDKMDAIICEQLLKSLEENNGRGAVHS